LLLDSVDLSIGDVTGDGVPDIVRLRDQPRSTAREVLLRRGTVAGGRRGWAAEDEVLGTPPLPARGVVARVWLRDFDGDGLVDVVTGLSMKSKVTLDEYVRQGMAWSKNKGPPVKDGGEAAGALLPAFGEWVGVPQLSMLMPMFESGDLVDLDGDGDGDFVTTTYNTLQDVTVPACDVLTYMINNQSKACVGVVPEDVRGSRKHSPPPLTMRPRLILCW
jgi:hypothetical protein